MIELSDIKRHLNVDFDEDDLLIESMIKATEASVEKSIGAPLSDITVDGKLPDDLLHVIRIMVAKLYEYREGNTYGKVQEVPYTLAHLIAPYIELS
jgi:uncharacterized phage protein (predicted DNA packaging)